MTGMSIFLLGTVALTNIGFLLYLMRDHNRNAKPTQEKPPGNTTSGCGRTS